VSVATLVAITGCGGGKGSSVSTQGGALATTPTGAHSTPAPASSSRPQSRKQFVATVEAICKQTNDEIAAHKARSSTDAEVVRVVPTHIRVERGGLAALERPSPPQSLKGAWERILGVRRTLTDELERLVDAVRNGRKKVVPYLILSKKHSHQLLNRTATQAGFRACAKLG
jgi:hypothetical protein